MEDVLADTSAPELEATAAPAPEVTTPDEQSTEASKTFTQEELDAAIGKRLAREQRKWEREQAARAAEANRPPAAMPSADQFNSVDDYAEALATRKAEELLAKRDAQRQRTEFVEAYHDREEDARNKYDDFEQVAYNPSLRITDVMAETIQTSDVGPDVAYFLGSNPKEADRIARLPPILQAKEIGKIEARLASDPPVKKSSSAPSPISPVTARGSGTSAYDTTDPRSVKAMSTSDWIAAERQRQIKKLEASKFR